MFMNQENIIISGDLNLYLGLVKSQGSQGQSDHLMVFFKNLLDSHNLLNIDLAKIKLTW